MNKFIHLQQNFMENNKKRTEDTGEIFMARINAVVVPAVNPGKVDPHSPFQIDPLKNDFKKGLKKAC